MIRERLMIIIHKMRTLMYLAICLVPIFALSCKTVDDDDDVYKVINSYITDTVYMDSVVRDTTIIENIVHDTIFSDSLLHDTTYVDRIIYDTIFVDSIIQETIVVERNIYHNPVIGVIAPDPSVIRATDGAFYLYSTSRNVSVFKSKNLTNWIYVGNAFEEATRPSIVSNATIWAPDINFINGKYVMYYSQSVWGGEWTCGIGIAVSDNPEGPFIDKGKLFTSKDIGVQNSIDPFFIEAEGEKYLFWGSLRGIYGIRLSDDGMSLMSGAEKFQVASSGVEGTYIHYHDGKYYLFA